jgi:hypothetical protein
MSISGSASEAMVGQWRLALADAGVHEDQVHLIAVPGLPGPKAPKAITYVAGAELKEEIPEEAILSGTALREANSPAYIDKVRVAATFTGYPEDQPVDLAILAGKLRHEVRHVEHRLSPVWTELFELEYLTYEVSARRAEGQPNERMFYTQMPTEVDANAAAARFLRRRHPLAVDGVLGTEDAVLASSATPPGTIEDLPEKCVDYLFAFREIAEALDLGDGLNHEKRMIAISAPAIERWRSLTE